MEIKNHKKITHLSLKLKKKKNSRKYKCMIKIFPKIDIKFYSNVATYNQTYVFMAHLVDCNSNYIGLRISNTRNTRCCNVIFITIHLFDDNTIIEP